MPISEEEYMLLYRRHIKALTKLRTIEDLMVTLRNIKVIDRKCFRDTLNELIERAESQQRVWSEIKDEYYGNML
jgi:hypothetical protein